MIKGTLFAMAACLIWGLIFVIPDLMNGFDSFEIALGRHFINGSISCAFLLAQGGLSKKLFPSGIWKKAFIFSLIVNIGYYTCLVMSVKFASPAIAALIVGVSPVVITFYGNWLEKECQYKNLIVPALFILLGLLLVNLPLFYAEELDYDRPYYFLGVLGAIASMSAWSWYVVSNSRFLKNNSEITAQEWSTLIGVSTFVWVVVLATIYESWLGPQNWEKFVTPSTMLWYYMGGCAFLGIFCSWGGTFLWNKASGLLPVSYAGQLTIFETIFGLLFFYLIEQEIPSLIEIVGVSFMLFAILYGMNTFIVHEPVQKKIQE